MKENDLNSKKLSKALGICPGITAVIGGGGKTTLLRRLAAELSVPSGGDPRPGVMLCTSTHIYPFTEYPCIEALPDGTCCLKTASKAGYEDSSPGSAMLQANTPLNVIRYDTASSIAGLIRAALELSPVICIGTLEESSGKYTAPALSFRELAKLADYVLVEADGSKGHPFKAHAPYEPVIPKGTVRTILVTGASAFLRPIGETVHRPEIFLKKLNAQSDSVPAGPDSITPCGPDEIAVFKNGGILTPESLLTPELAAAFINMEGLSDICLLTQTDRLYQKAAYSILSPKANPRMEGAASEAFSGEIIQRFRKALSIPLITASL